MKRAVLHAQKGLHIAREIKGPVNEAFRLWELGNAHYHLEQTKEAISYLQRSEIIFSEINSPNIKRVQEQLSKLRDFL